MTSARGGASPSAPADRGGLRSLERLVLAAALALAAPLVIAAATCGCKGGAPPRRPPVVYADRFGAPVVPPSLSACDAWAEARELAPLARALHGDLVIVRPGGGVVDHAEIGAAALRAGAESAEPELAVRADILASRLAGPRELYGITAGTRAKLAHRVVEGSLAGLDDGGVAIGSSLARALGLGVGAELRIRLERLATRAGTPAGAGTAVVADTRVVAILDYGHDELTPLGSGMMLADLAAVRRFADASGDEANRVIVHVAGGVPAPELVEALQAEIGGELVLGRDPTYDAFSLRVVQLSTRCER